MNYSGLIPSVQGTGPRPVECLDLKFEYKGGALATKGVTLGLGAGDLLCLLGPNGAGKTTLLRLITGDLRPISGHVRIFGKDPFGDPRAKRGMGIIPQSVNLFFSLTVAEHLRYFAGLKGLARHAASKAVSSVVQSCQLEGLLTKRAGHLSGGQQRAVLLALALLGDPEVLILDEPTVGLDPAARRVIWSLIERQRDSGRAILLTTHYMEEAEHLASRIAFLEEGRLTCDGTLRDVLARFGGGVRLVDGGGESTVHRVGSVAEAQALAVRLGLTDYAISRATLEDVYLRLSDRGAAQ